MNQSIVELLHPLFRKSLSPSSPQCSSLNPQQDIAISFTQLHSHIDQLAEAVKRRMILHEDSLFKVAAEQVEIIKQHCTKAIAQFNTKALAIHHDEELLYLREERSFFQNSAKQLQSDNFKLRNQISLLSKQLQETRMQLETQHDALKRLQIKILRFRKEIPSIELCKKTESPICQSLIKQVSFSSRHRNKNRSTLSCKERVWLSPLPPTQELKNSQLKSSQLRSSQLRDSQLRDSQLKEVWIKSLRRRFHSRTRPTELSEQTQVASDSRYKE